MSGQQLLPLIEQFNQIMDRVVELVEETKAEVKQLPSVSLEESPRKMQEIFDLCHTSVDTLKKAIATAEEIDDTIGR